jgi:hypothetical protein
VFPRHSGRRRRFAFSGTTRVGEPRRERLRSNSFQRIPTEAGLGLNSHSVGHGTHYVASVAQLAVSGKSPSCCARSNRSRSNASPLARASMTARRAASESSEPASTPRHANSCRSVLFSGNVAILIIECFSPCRPYRAKTCDVGLPGALVRAVEQNSRMDRSGVSVQHRHRYASDRQLSACVSGRRGAGRGLRR